MNKYNTTDAIKNILTKKNYNAKINIFNKNSNSEIITILINYEYKVCNINIQTSASSCACENSDNASEKSQECALTATTEPTAPASLPSEYKVYTYEFRNIQGVDECRISFLDCTVN